ncbi:hypothetical protein C8R43DRAFT_965128, partial [Mycena crocata]
MADAQAVPAGSQGSPWLVSDSPDWNGADDPNFPVAVASRNLSRVLNRIASLEAPRYLNSSGRNATQQREARRLDIRELRYGPLPRPTLPRNPVPTLGASSAVGRSGPNALAATGWRLARDRPLRHEDLWVDGVGPPEQLPLQEHHKCGICHFVKSHPVTIGGFPKIDMSGGVCQGIPESRQLSVLESPFAILPLFINRDFEVLGCATIAGGSGRGGGFVPGGSAHAQRTTAWAALWHHLREAERAGGRERSQQCSHVRVRMRRGVNVFWVAIKLRLTTSVDNMANRRGRRPYKNVVDYSYAEHGQFEFTFTADRGIYLSADGLRRTEELMHVAHKKQRLTLLDALAHWIPVSEEGFSEEAARLPPPSSVADTDAVGGDEEDEDGDDNDNDDAATILGKRQRKKYKSTTDPMSRWRPKKSMFLDELLRHEGLGDDLDKPECAHCHSAFSQEAENAVQLFKCEDCGEFLQCLECSKNKQEWSGYFWLPRTLADIGLIYQLGHGGFPCPSPEDTVRKLTVIEAPVIHRIKARYCKCDKSDDADNLEQLLRNKWYPATVTDPGTCATFRSLEAYRLFNVAGNMNVRDYITALEEMTDAGAKAGLTWLPDRYKQFQRMARQWSFLMRLKRAGRGHDLAGPDATKLGECGVDCWACPFDGRNLPPDWRNADPESRYLYMLILAMDANFRLKNRMRPNEIDDPSLGPGWGYWISSCISFAALLQKDTRMTTGLRVSGVGGVVCARHECVQPNGLGDLQKGERYANMDFILMSALAGRSLQSLTISYDIACQWKTNLAARNAKLPSKIQLPLDKLDIQCALPVWHAASHNEECQNANSLSFKPGVGKSDGEGVERVWSRLNPGAHSTKDAGRGQRADTMEGKIDYLNHGKNLGQ